MMCKKKAIWFVWVGKCTAPGLESPKLKLNGVISVKTVQFQVKSLGVGQPHNIYSPVLESLKLQLNGVISKNSTISGKITWGWTAQFLSGKCKFLLFLDDFEVVFY